MEDWIFNGKDFQRMDAATGNERRPTVDSRNGGSVDGMVERTVDVLTTSEDDDVRTGQ